MKIKNILPNEIKELLTESTLDTLQTAITNKINLCVEAALTSQDTLYSKKLKELIDVRDKDYTKKFKRALNLREKVMTHKLKSVVRKYENEISKDANKFKDVLVEQISNYIEEYIDEAIPSEAILEATQNRSAKDVLSNLRRVLSIDSALMSESVKDAVIDGKKTINSLNKQINEIKNQNQKLIAENNKVKAMLILNEKVSGFNADKKNYILRVLSDKTPEFINENFEYTVRLFERDEKHTRKNLQAEAFKKRIIKEEVVKESTGSQIQERKYSGTEAYLPELQKAK